MQAAYDEYNDHARSSGKSRGHFIVDLCRPGHLTICLRNFQERIKCNDDNWDAQFGELEAQLLLRNFHPTQDHIAKHLIIGMFTSEHMQCKLLHVVDGKVHVTSGEYWTSADIVDCILSYTVTQLMDIMTDPNSREGVEMLARVCIMPEALHAHTAADLSPVYALSAVILR